MKWSLRHTYKNVPYFKAKCGAHGAHPEDFRALGDLAGFPFTTKEDLRRNYPFGLFAVPKDGPHIWEDHFYPEIVDPVTGDVLADGEEGTPSEIAAHPEVIAAYLGAEAA